MKKRFSFLVAVILAVTVLSPGVATGVPPLGGYVGSWEISAGGGFGVGPANATAGPLVEYDGDLYAAVANENGCQVWKRGAGDWTKVNGQPGFGDANNQAIARMVTFDGKLYAGTANRSTGCEVWEYDGDNWQKVKDNGFGKAGNIGVTAMEVFDGKLYVGVANLVISLLGVNSNGGEIYSYGGGAWTEEMTGGFGDTKNMAVSSLETYKESLYAGTTRVDITTEIIGFTSVKATLTSLGCELRKLVGADWPKVAGDGFTDGRNAAVSAMEVFEGKLYIGTTNGDATAMIEIATLEVSEYDYDTDGLYVYTYDGNGISEEIKGGFDSPDEFSVNEMATMDVTGSDMLLVGVGRVEGMGRLMAFDGSDWFPGALDGFGNTDNRAIAGVAAFGGKAYAGTGNDTAGCEVWFGTPPASRGELSETWYLAEGCTNEGFETWVLVQNPGDESATAQLTYMTGAGEVPGPTLELLPHSRQSVEVAKIVPNEWDVSTKVTADRPVIAERSVYWNQRIGGHDSIGVTAPSSVWYLAEGCTNEGFETWVLVQNPGDESATAQLTYMTGAGEVPGPTLELLPHSRQSVEVAKIVPNEWDVSTKVTADRPVIAERSVYWNQRIGGHDSIGVTAPSSVWYLAEGCTNEGFETWVLVQNPGDESATAQLTYMTGAGEVPGPTLELLPHSRQSVEVAKIVPNEWDVSTKVTADRPVIAERSVYWNQRIGGHDSIGVTAPSSVWYLAEGCTNEGFETWVLVQNPGDESATAQLTYMTGAGEVPGPTLELLPHSRQSVEVAKIVPNEWDVSTKVTADRPVIAERSVYWNQRIGGHDSIGARI